MQHKDEKLQKNLLAGRIASFASLYKEVFSKTLHFYCGIDLYYLKKNGMINYSIYSASALERRNK
jgi:hypothetical protein